MKTLVLIPAYNEFDTLGAVVDEVRDVRPDLPILIIDDASTDGTGDRLPHLGTLWLQLGQNLGLGGAMRAGLRFARLRGFDAVVRLDADGQHRAADIEAVLGGLTGSKADAVVGSRYHHPGEHGISGLRRAAQWMLGRYLSVLTGSPVTDPTSGFWAFGPAAVRCLGDHYPRGYSEPELYLFLHRNGLRIAETPVSMRPRQGGDTTLTPARTALALARISLGMLIGPLRRGVRRSDV